MGTRKLTLDSFEEASDYVLHSARALERNTYNYFFNGDDNNKSLLELKNYQNPDGGFGHGLEPDLRLPYSSPIATTFAFRQLEKLGEKTDVAEDIIQSGICYLKESFCRDENRWYSVPPEINEYPHAPWWHYSEDSGGTAIDESWGNPTAEILAYGLKYDGISDEIDIDSLLSEAIRNFNEKDEFKSEHEVYCYLKLYDVLPKGEASKIEGQLKKAVDQLVHADPSAWNEYVPQPLDFVSEPDSPRFGISETSLENNLDFLIERIDEDGAVRPNWSWGQFESEWERAELEWTGILTLNALITLEKFDRIPRKE